MSMEIEMKSLGEKIGEVGKKVGTWTDEVKNLKDVVADIQVQIKKNAVVPSKGISEEIKGMVDFVAGRADTPETKTASVANGPNGGYFAIPEFIANVVPKIYESYPVLSEITTYNVDANVAAIPIEVGEPDVQWVGELQEISESDVDLGMANIPMNQLSAAVSLSNTLIRNSNWIDAENYLIDRTTKAVSRGLGKAVLLGTGFKQPEGILSCKKIKSTKSGAAKGITTDTIFDVFGDFPSELENPKWMMSKATFLSIAKQFGKDSSYVNMPLGDGIPPMILGTPVIFADIPGLESDGNKAIVLGDFRAGYIGLQGTSMEYIRDNITKARKSMTLMTYNMPFGGQVVAPDAFRVITTGA